MYYRDYLEEAIKDVDPKLRVIFNKALMQIFSPIYINKISKHLKTFLLIKEVDEKEGIVAYNMGNKIYINKKEFYTLPLESQARYLLHEFIHILQRRGGLFTKFPEIRKLTKELYSILKEHSTQPLSVFLTGKNQNLGPGKEWEILSYFMNNSIEWGVLDTEGAKKVVAAIKSYPVFNTETPFWKKRLPY